MVRESASLLAALAAALPVAAQRLIRPGAQRLEGTLTSQVRWVRGDAPAQHYPPAARAQGIDGQVTVDLLINESGQVVEAQVLNESPAGYGFGLAALDTAKTYEFENRLGKLVLMSLSVQFQP